MNEPPEPSSELDAPGAGREPLFNLRPWDGPGATLCAIMIAVFLAGIFTGGPVRWATSAQALAFGHVETLLTHMFVHAGWMHLLMNLGALFALSRVVVHRIGADTGGWLRYLALFFLSGLAGAGLFLAIHPGGGVPMLGASGAICGLWGAAARLAPDGQIAPLRSRQVWRTLREFVVMNLVLFVLLLGIVGLSGGVGGLAWEAHLGGFVFGLFAAPLLVKGRSRFEGEP